MAQSGTQGAVSPFDAGVAALGAGNAAQAAKHLLAAVAEQPQDVLRCNYLLYALYLAEGLDTDEFKPRVASFLENPLLLNIGLLVRVWVRMARRDDIAGAPWDALATPFFLGGLRLAAIPDVVVEDALTRLRTRLLDLAVAGGDAPEAAVTVAESLAICCFNNEYVFAETVAEREAVTKLAARKDHNALELAVVASYERLDRHDHIVRGLKGIIPPKNRKILARLVAQQIEEPAEEMRLRAEIPAVGGIADDVSQAVRAQYEANPYPRWVNLGGVFNDDAELPLARLAGKAAPSFLVAGCATGRYPIGVAVSRQKAAVTGIDLSLTSLGYATRMARKHGVRNLSFVHGDILDVAGLGKKFDCIESVGVLHHMKEPARGLRALCDVLADDGYIKLGLYSRTARRHIMACQNDLKAMGLPPTAEGIRAARSWMAALPEGHAYKTMLQYDDYYTTSMIRDMLFHVQEHVFDIAGVSTLLDGAGLRLLGFVNLQPPAAAAFAAMYPDPAARADFACWDAFERAHPDSFIGMYRFWADKKR